MRNDPEYQLCVAVSTYLRLQYPKVIFHFDYAGLNLSKAQAGKMKAMQGERGFPDLCIYKRKSDIVLNNHFNALFIELKKEGERIFKKNGAPASDHIAEQVAMIERLNKEGYYATFCVGFDEAKSLIDWYLK
jgi:hypothetical protein